jgi:hypothetical protein
MTVIRQEGGKLNYIEQRELYQFTKDRGSSNNFSNDTVPAFAKTLPNCCPTEYEAKPLTDSLKSTQMAESVVLHDHPSTPKDVPEPTNSKLMVAESVASKGAIQCDKRAQYQSVYSSDSRLSSISTSAQSSPTALSISSQITSENQSNILSPCALSSAVMQVDSTLFGEGGGPNQRVPAPLMVSGSGSYTLSHPSPQLYLQQGFTAESHPGHLCSSAIMISPVDFSLSPAAILHTASGIDSIPFSATLTPFWNPNFIPQAPLSHFNPENPLSSDSSNTAISSPYQVLDTPIFPGNSISGSMPGTAHNVNSLGSIRANDCPMQQPAVGATTMYNSSLSMLASVTDPATSVDSVYFPPYP